MFVQRVLLHSVHKAQRDRVRGPLRPKRFRTTSRQERRLESSPVTSQVKTLFTMQSSGKSDKAGGEL